MTDGFEPFAGGFWISKDPDDVLDYERDWSAWLAEEGDDMIASVEWIVDSGLTVVTEKNSNTTTTATVWLAGGRTKDASFEVRCRSK